MSRSKKKSSSSNNTRARKTGTGTCMYVHRSSNNNILNISTKMIGYCSTTTNYCTFVFKTFILLHAAGTVPGTWYDGRGTWYSSTGTWYLVLVIITICVVVLQSLTTTNHARRRRVVVLKYSTVFEVR